MFRRCIGTYSNESENVGKIDGLEKGLDSTCRLMQKGLGEIHKNIEEVENKQRSFLDSLQKELETFKEEIRNEFKDLSKHFERDN